MLIQGQVPEAVCKKIVNWAVRVVDIDPGDKVLDIQCGSGQLLRLYDHKKVRTFGIDEDAAALAEGHLAKNLHCGVVAKFGNSNFLTMNSKYKVITYLYFDQSKLDQEFFRVVSHLMHPEGVLILLTDDSRLNWTKTWFADKGFDVAGCEIFPDEVGEVMFVALFVTFINHDLNGYALLANDKFMLYKNLIHLQLEEYRAEEELA